MVVYRCLTNFCRQWQQKDRPNCVDRFKDCVCTYNSPQHPALLRMTFTFSFSTRRSVCNRWLQRSKDGGCGGEVQSRGGGVEGSCPSCVWPERPRHSCRPPLARQVHHEELLGARITTLTLLCPLFFTTSTCHMPPFATKYRSI